MFRSSDAGRLLGVVLLSGALLTSGCGVLGGGPEDHEQRAAHGGDTPDGSGTSPIPSVVPLPEAGQGARGRVLDIHTPVVDLSLTVSSIDGSIKNTTTGERRKVTLAADVLFGFDKATLTKEARSRLKQAGGIIREHAEGTVEIHGYTDSKGSKAYNLKLSRRRGRAVKQALTKMLEGDAYTFVVKGHGEANPVAPNTKPNGVDNPDGRAKNRRVEITFRQ